MKKVYAVFRVTKKGKLKLDQTFYFSETEEEANDSLSDLYGTGSVVRYLVLPMFIQKK
jgi:hypothetical protein